MAASSVSGVGQGSALKAGQKGAESMNLGVERLIGVRIVHSGTVTLVGGVKAVLFPDTLPGLNSDYIVIAGGSANYAYATLVTTTGFTMNGTGTQTVSYIVVRVDNATVTTG